MKGRPEPIIKAVERMKGKVIASDASREHIAEALAVLLIGTAKHERGATQTWETMLASMQRATRH